MKITQELLRELFDYNPDTGLIVWKRRERKWFKKDHSQGTWNTKYAGKVAGCRCATNGYVNIILFGRPLKAHRLIWLYLYGRFPKEQLDHINHIRHDNRLINLREVDSQENRHNSPLSKKNTSGFNGVYYHPKSKKWCAEIKVNWEKIWLGRYDTKEQAINARVQANSLYGFHPNHGMGISGRGAGIVLRRGGSD